MYIYIGGGYTGALSFASVRDEIYVYKSGGQKDGGKPSDILVRLDRSGAIKKADRLAKATCVGRPVRGRKFAFRS